MKIILVWSRSNQNNITGFPYTLILRWQSFASDNTRSCAMTKTVLAVNEWLPWSEAVDKVLTMSQRCLSAATVFYITRTNCCQSVRHSTSRGQQKRIGPLFTSEWSVAFADEAVYVGQDIAYSDNLAPLVRIMRETESPALILRDRAIYRPSESGALALASRAHAARIKFLSNMRRECSKS